MIENHGSDPLEVETFRDMERCSGRVPVHPAIREGGPLTLRIPGGAPFTLWSRIDRPFSSRGEAIGRIAGAVVCSGAVTFEPQAGRRYVARFHLFPSRDDISAPGRCYGDIVDEVRAWDGSALRTRISLRWRTERACD